MLEDALMYKVFNGFWLLFCIVWMIGPLAVFGSHLYADECLTRHQKIVFWVSAWVVAAWYVFGTILVLIWLYKGPVT